MTLKSWLLALATFIVGASVSPVIFSIYRFLALDGAEPVFFDATFYLNWLALILWFPVWSLSLFGLLSVGIAVAKAPIQLVRKKSHIAIALACFAFAIGYLVQEWPMSLSLVMVYSCGILILGPVTGVLVWAMERRSINKRNQTKDLLA